MSDAPFSGGKNKSSQFDPGGVIKNVHDLYGQNLRVRDALSVAPDYWSHFTVVYNPQNNPTDVSYFRGLTPNKTSIQTSPDVSGSLQNKYFYIFSGYDNQKHHVWLNVGGAGTDPAPSNSVGIEVAIDQNDPANIIAKAIQLTINNLFNVKFTASVVSNSVTIQNQAYGQFNPSIDVNTSFVILSETGINQLVSNITIAYDLDNNPIYQGQVLKNYYYDVYSGKFQKAAEFNGNVVSTDPTGKLIPVAFDKIEVASLNGNGDPLVVIYYYQSNIVATLNITYDLSGNLSSVERV